MVNINPFSASPVEEREIRQLGNILFRGGNPSAHDELIESYGRWSSFFKIFLQIIDRKTGSFLTLPFADDAFSQPSKTMTIFMIMQDIYIRTLAEALKRN